MCHASLSFKTKQSVTLSQEKQLFQAHEMPENQTVQPRTTANEVKV